MWVDIQEWTRVKVLASHIDATREHRDTKTTKCKYGWSINVNKLLISFPRSGTMSTLKKWP